jgi:HEAT repeat protein
VSEEPQNEHAPQLGGDSAPTPSNIEPALSLDHLLPGLREAFESKNRGKRLTTVEQLRNSGSVQVVPLLVELMETTEDSITRNRCVAMLGQLGDERAIDALVRLLADNDIRTTAIWALGQIRSPKAFDPLAALLDHETDLRITTSIIASLAEIGDFRAASILLRMSEADTHNVIATSIVAALKLLARNMSLSQLIELLYQEDEKVRTWAMDRFVNHRETPQEVHFHELVKLLQYTNTAGQISDTGQCIY